MGLYNLYEDLIERSEYGETEQSIRENAQRILKMMQNAMKYKLMDEAEYQDLVEVLKKKHRILRELSKLK